MKAKTKLIHLGFICAISMATMSSNADEVKLNAVSFLPRTSDITQTFINFIDEVNKKGEGVVKINYLGGPETIPSSKLAQAVSNGTVDLAYITPGRFTGSVPEADALLGSNLSIKTLHENGAMDLLDETMQEQINSHLLAAFLTPPYS
jgi:TRAP-type C4-dicarboxylate transport system substrate-binding protein|tara:strand:- start:51 stop:494 length:444 start_codon:yes stop_codon:yes gene_type:complete